MDFLGLKRKKDLTWFQDERLTTEFQAKYYDRLTNFRINIKSEEDKLLKETLMRVKSIKIKDDIPYRSIKQHDNALNENKDRLFIKKSKSPIEQFLDTYDFSSKLEKEKLIILKQFHKNTLETAKRLSFLNETFKNKTPRSKSTLQASTDDNSKNNTNKRIVESRPKTTVTSVTNNQAKRLIMKQFNETIDGSRIEIKNINAPPTYKVIEPILENPEIVNLNELIPPNTAASKANTDAYSDLTLKSSNYFPNLKASTINSTIIHDDSVSVSPFKLAKPTKQLLKTKPAKLLFFDSNNILNEFTKADAALLNTNELIKVEEKTKKKQEIRKKKLLFKREKELRGLNNYNYNPPNFDPPSTPTSSYYDIEFLKSKSVRHPNSSRSKDTSQSTQSSSFIINKISKSDENRMNINDLIKYMKPIDNQSLESKSIENLGPVLQVNNGNKKKYKANIPVASTSTNIPIFPTNFAKTPYSSTNNFFTTAVVNSTNNSSTNSTSNTNNKANNIAIIASDRKNIINIEENSNSKVPKNNNNSNSKIINNTIVINNDNNLVRPSSKSFKMEEIKPERFELSIKIPLGNDPF